MDRRQFITLSAISGAGLLAARCASPVKLDIGEANTTTLKLSSQESVAPGESLNEKLDFLEQHGFTGLEPWGGGLEKRVTEMQKALQNRSVNISAVVAGFSGFLIAKDPVVRKEAIDSIKIILEAAGALGSGGLIVVPAFNHQESLPHVEARQLLVELLKELGEHAQRHNTRLLLEPLNRREAWFLRMLADAAAIAKDSGSDGIGVMGDFWHMTWEETSDLGAIFSAAGYLHHMHIASRQNRRMPGEDENDDYTEGFKALKHIGYQGYISLECGSAGNRLETIPAAANLIREQWERASMC